MIFSKNSTSGVFRTLEIIAVIKKLNVWASIQIRTFFSILLDEKVGKRHGPPHYCWRWDPPTLSHQSYGLVG